MKIILAVMIFALLAVSANAGPFIPVNYVSTVGATGATGATGAKGDTGSTGAKGETGTVNAYCAQYFDTGTDTNISANATNLIDFEGVSYEYGFTVEHSATYDSIVIPETGVYEITLSVNAKKTAAGTDTMSTWMIVNNVSVPYSSKQAGTTAAANPVNIISTRIIALNKNDRVTFAWASSATSFALRYLATNPETPSVSISIFRIR